MEPAARRHVDRDRVTLFFVCEYRSGASRRMESLVAWVKVTQKRHLTVLEVDVELHPKLVEQLGVTTAPALVLVKDHRVVGLIEGKVSGREIDDFIRPHLGPHLERTAPASGSGTDPSAEDDPGTFDGTTAGRV